MEDQTHYLEFVGKTPCHEEAWRCPRCGRAVILDTKTGQHTVAEVGNIDIVHRFGEKGQAAIALGQVNDPYLTPYLTWMKDHHIE